VVLVSVLAAIGGGGGNHGSFDHYSDLTHRSTEKASSLNLGLVLSSLFLK
jgi:hypothetical protein